MFVKIPAILKIHLKYKNHPWNPAQTRYNTQTHAQPHAHTHTYTRRYALYDFSTMYLYIPSSNYYILTYAMVVYKVIFPVLAKLNIFESKGCDLSIFIATMWFHIVDAAEPILVTDWLH